MITLRGNCTKRSLWIAAVGTFVLILCVGVVLAAPPPRSRSATTAELLLRPASERLRHTWRMATRSGPAALLRACQPSIAPVICEVGGTFIDQCVADCAGAEGCERLCACQPQIDPVLCSDGNTYINPCIADCVGAGPNCDRLCVCQPSLAPSSATAATSTSTPAPLFAPVRTTAPGSAPARASLTRSAARTAGSSPTSAKPIAPGRRTVSHLRLPSPRSTRSSARTATSTSTCASPLNAAGRGGRAVPGSAPASPR